MIRDRSQGYKAPHDKDPDGIVEWTLDAGSVLVCVASFALVYDGFFPGIWHDLLMLAMGR